MTSINKQKTDGRSKRKTGRTTQLNTRVTLELRDGMHERAEKAGVTFGRLFELMMAAWDREQQDYKTSGVAPLLVPQHLIAALEVVARDQRMTPAKALEQWLISRMKALGHAREIDSSMPRRLEVPVPIDGGQQTRAGCPPG